MGAHMLVLCFVAYWLWGRRKSPGHPACPSTALHHHSSPLPATLLLLQQNHMFGLPPAHYDKWPILRDSFHMLSTSKDRCARLVTTGGRMRCRG